MQIEFFFSPGNALAGLGLANLTSQRETFEPRFHSLSKRYNLTGFQVPWVTWRGPISPVGIFPGFSPQFQISVFPY
jgi:hypothetical protein